MQATAKQLGFSIGRKSEWISKAARKAALIAAGFDPANGRDVSEFVAGFNAARSAKTAENDQATRSLIGSRNVYRLGAEHRGGASVGHCCTTGVYSDPTDFFDLLVVADSEDQAEQVGLDELTKRIDESKPCKCAFHKQAGGERWWSSVCVRAEQITAGEVVSSGHKVAALLVAK